MIVHHKRGRPASPFARHARARQLGDLGDGVTPAKLGTDFEGVIAAKSAQWDRTLTNAAAYKILADDLARAQTFKATAATMNNLLPGQLGAITSMVGALQAVRNKAKLAYDSFPNEPFAFNEDARAATVAPLQWLAAVAGHELASSNDRVQLVKDLMAAPKNALASVLGLPSWAIPVALAVGGLVLLGHVTGTIKALLPARA